MIDPQSASTVLTPARIDSPGIGIGVTNNQIRVAREDHFTDYLMFISDREGSVWVTLRKMQWNWSGSATNTAGGWVVDSQSNTKSNSSDSTELPVWTNYTGNLQWQ